MIYDVQGTPLYVYTGGKTFDPTKPTAVFIHGVLNDHSVWILQTRYFANHGWNVMAVDLPGHGRSGGKAPASVQEAAQSIMALLDAAGVVKAMLIGHSFGSLIALHATAENPGRVSQLMMVGTAYPMRVSPALLESSLNDPQKAIQMVNVFWGLAHGYWAAAKHSCDASWPAIRMKIFSTSASKLATAMTRVKFQCAK
jgi:pimeloyl-ACP methyl ester carboxylesterase